MPDYFTHQLEGGVWLAERDNALLADKAGLGKTAQAIMAADLRGARNILVLCPSAAKHNWVKEFTKFSRVIRPVTMPSARHPFTSGGLTVVNYDIVARPSVFYALQRQRWDVLIADEMHFLKAGLDSKRGRAVLGKADSLVHSADAVWGLSATPSPNHPGELYPWLSAVSPQVLQGLPDYEKFLTAYTDHYFHDKYGLRVVGSKNLDNLKKRIAPVLLRRDKSVLQLPPLRVGTVSVKGKQLPELSSVEGHPDAQKLADIIVALQADDTAAGFEAALETYDNEMLARLRRLVGIVKAHPLAEMVADELNSGTDKIVVMCWHKEVMDIFAAALAKFRPVQIRGGVSALRAQQAVDDFQADPNVRVFIGQIQSAGTAITLTAAHDTLFAEMSWVPGENEQAVERIHRIGQTSPCLARFASLEGSIDELVTAVIARKVAGLVALYETR